MGRMHVPLDRRSERTRSLNGTGVTVSTRPQFRNTHLPSICSHSLNATPTHNHIPWQTDGYRIGEAPVDERTHRRGLQSQRQFLARRDAMSAPMPATRTATAPTATQMAVVPVEAMVCGRVFDGVEGCDGAGAGTTGAVVVGVDGPGAGAEGSGVAGVDGPGAGAEGSGVAGVSGPGAGAEG